MDKTYWDDSVMVFLGLLLDLINRRVCLPQEKVDKTLLIQSMMNKRNSKVTVKQVQQVCGILNFLGRAIVPGRAFTRRLYSILGGDVNHTKLLPHHHVRLTKENKLDLELWKVFLSNQAAYSRNFMDFLLETNAQEIPFFSDASKNPELGCGAYSEMEWFSKQWDKDFITKYDPSITYLELFGLTVAVKLWIHKYKDQHVIIHCDNQTVVQMINNSTSSCKNCMLLIRIVVMECLIWNVRLFALYVSTKSNGIADALSRLEYIRFHRLTEGKDMKPMGCKIPEILWPMNKLWRDETNKSY